MCLNLTWRQEIINKSPQPALHGFIYLLGMFAAVSIFGLIALALSTPLTPSGVAYLAGCTLVIFGALGSPWLRGNYGFLVLAGILLVALTALARLSLTGRNTSFNMVTLPESGRGRWIDRLVDEQDVSLFSARVMPWVGLTYPSEETNLIPAMQTLYVAMRESEGTLPSPFVSTYLGLQKPGSFEALVFEPTTASPARVGAIFLHGFTGNFTMPCWLFARAAREIGAVTVCPSTRWVGDWWTADGETILRATIDYLHGRGVSEIYLAGLSNGGIGASELAPKLSSELKGLILISGASPRGVSGSLPVLVIHGSDDARIPASIGRAFAERAGGNGTYIEFQGDHFVFAKRADEVRDSIAAWLMLQESVVKISERSVKR